MNEGNLPAPVLLRRLAPRNLLSFGPQSQPVALGALNVLVGPNGSGKSNLIEAVALLRAAAGDLRAVLRRGGGVSEWIWKGDPQATGTLEAVVEYPQGRQPLRHALAFSAEGQVFRLEDERIENERPEPGEALQRFFYRYQPGHPPAFGMNSGVRYQARDELSLDESILAQRRDPQGYPEITYLANAYGKIRIYREWVFGRSTALRQPQPADGRSDRLEEDFSNLGLFLNRLRRNPGAESAILEGLRNLYDGLDDFDISVEGGTVQVFFTEGKFTIPATRLSDGALRYLCLLAILCDPTPPPLICIEEPELGLHPDILPRLADLLLEASGRAQLIVTTHSDLLVDALTGSPEAVLICEKHDSQTRVERLDAEKLKHWLGEYRLGELWTRGELGGTRW